MLIMKRLLSFIAMAAILVTFACTKNNENGNENGGGGGKEVSGTDYTKTTDFALVDLGLSVKWASMNLGAAASWEIGGYYPWGNYSSSGSLGQGGFTNLRVPTKQEWEELQAECSRNTYREEVNGVKGFIFTSKKNGNKIFFPCAGTYSTYTGSYMYVGERAYYWTATPHESIEAKAYSSYLSDGIKGVELHDKVMVNLPVRLVQ